MRLFTFVLLLGLVGCQRGPIIRAEQLTAICVQKQLTCKVEYDGGYKFLHKWKASATDSYQNYWMESGDSREEVINQLGHALSAPPNFPATEYEILNEPRK